MAVADPAAVIAAAAAVTPRQIGRFASPARVPAAVGVVSTHPAVVIAAEGVDIHAGSAEPHLRRTSRTPRRW